MGPCTMVELDGKIYQLDGSPEQISKIPDGEFIHAKRVDGTGCYLRVSEIKPVMIF